MECNFPEWTAESVKIRSYLMVVTFNAFSIHVHVHVYTHAHIQNVMKMEF